MRKSIYSAEYAMFLCQLRDARVQAGLTQDELGDLLGMSQSDVSKCERGERRLDVVELWRWCEALGVSFSAFTRRLDNAIERGRG